MDFRSSYLKVEVCLCEILVQCRRQVLDCSDYNTAVREQGVGRVKRLTMASYSLASTVYGPCANFLSTTSSRVRCDFKGERDGTNPTKNPSWRNASPVGSRPSSAITWPWYYFSLGPSFLAYKRRGVRFNGSSRFLPVQRVILVFWGPWIMNIYYDHQRT